MGLEITDPTTVLIDKVVISAIQIIDILDFEDLVLGNIVILSTSPYKYKLPDGKSFARLEIKDDGVINRFSAGALGGEGFLQKYCTLEMCIPGGDKRLWTAWENQTSR